MNIRDRIKNSKYDAGVSELRKQLLDAVVKCGYTTKEEIGRLVETELRSHPDTSLSSYDLQKLIIFLVSSVNAFEIITDEFDKDGIDTIYVNSPNCIIVETKDGLRDMNIIIADMDKFIDDILRNCSYDTLENGYVINAISPTGVRFHIVKEPYVLSFPVMVIKKFYPQVANFQSLIDNGFIIDKMADFLSAAVSASKNIIIKGLPNSGKTTLLNALTSKIRADQRVVIVSDFEEIVLPHKNVVRCKSKGLGYSELMKLIPQRVVVDSCGNCELVNDLIKSDTSGIIIATDDITPDGIQTSNAVVVELKKLRDGSRKIISVYEGQELFRFDSDYVEDGKVMGKFEILCDIPTYETQVDDFELEQLADLSGRLSPQ